MLIVKMGVVRSQETVWGVSQSHRLMYLFDRHERKRGNCRGYGEGRGVTSAASAGSEDRWVTGGAYTSA